MESMRESWTDKRLDDLNEKVDRGFGRIDADLRAQRVETRTEFIELRGEMKDGFGRVDQRFENADDRAEGLRRDMTDGFDALREEMKKGFERMEERFDERVDALHRLMIQFCGLVVAALIGLIAVQL